MTNKSEKIKIIYFITKSNFGGAQKYVCSLAKAAKKNGFDTLVVSGGNGRLNYELLKNDIRTSTVLSFERDVSPIKDAKSLIGIYKIIKKEKPDIIHLNSSKVGLLGAIVGRMLKVKKIIFTSHGWTFNEDRSFLSRKILKALQWITVVLSHKTIAVSEKTKNDMANMPFVKEKILIIRNGLEINSIEEKKNAREILREKFHLPVTDYIIGSISELHKNKGIEYLISGFKDFAGNHPNASVVIIGEGENRQSLEDCIKRENLKEKIFMPGFIPNASSLIKAFDVFVLSSTTEALPYVVLEAGFVSRPIIATNVGGIPEIIENGKSGILINPKSSTEIGKMLEYLHENKQTATEMGEELHKKICKEYMIDKQINKTLKLYN